ncbi:hypothetical protein MMPV_008760 [Pyropia vietnamensis]
MPDLAPPEPRRDPWFPGGFAQGRNAADDRLEELAPADRDAIRERLRWLWPQRQRICPKANTDLPVFRSPGDVVVVDALHALYQAVKSITVDPLRPAIERRFIASDIPWVSLGDPALTRPAAAWERTQRDRLGLLVAYGQFEVESLPLARSTQLFAAVPNWWGLVEVDETLPVPLPDVVIHWGTWLARAGTHFCLCAVVATHWAGNVLSAVASAVRFDGRLYPVSSTLVNAWMETKPWESLALSPDDRKLLQSVVTLSLTLDWRRIEKWVSQWNKENPLQPGRVWIRVNHVPTFEGQLEVAEWIGYASVPYAAGVRSPLLPQNPGVPPGLLFPPAPLKSEAPVEVGHHPAGGSGSGPPAPYAERNDGPVADEPYAASGGWGYRGDDVKPCNSPPPMLHIGGPPVEPLRRVDWRADQVPSTPGQEIPPAWLAALEGTLGPLPLAIRASTMDALFMGVVRSWMALAAQAGNVSQGGAYPRLRSSLRAMRHNVRDFRLQARLLEEVIKAAAELRTSSDSYDSEEEEEEEEAPPPVPRKRVSPPSRVPGSRLAKMPRYTIPAAVPSASRVKSTPRVERAYLNIPGYEDREGDPELLAGPQVAPSPPVPRKRASRKKAGPQAPRMSVVTRASRRRRREQTPTEDEEEDPKEAGGYDEEGYNEEEEPDAQ